MRRYRYVLFFVIAPFLAGCLTYIDLKNQGDFYFVKGRYDQAIESYTQAIEKMSLWPVLYVDRGTAYLWANRYDKALRDANRALGLKPTYAAAYTLKGAVHFKRARYDHAIAEFTNAIGADPSFVTAYQNRGKTYFLLKQHKKAQEDIDAGLRISANDISLIMEHGKIALRLGRYDDAVSDFSKAIDNRPSPFPSVLNARGIAYALKGNYEFAIYDFHKAAAISPEYADSYLNKAVTYDVEGLVTAARDAYNEYLRHAGKEEQYFTEFVKSWLESADEALRLAEDAKKNPEDPWAHFEWAKLFSRRYFQSHYKVYLAAALREIDESLRLKPDFDKAKILRVSMLSLKALETADVMVFFEASEALDDLTQKNELSPEAELHILLAHTGLELSLIDSSTRLNELTLKYAKLAVKQEPSSAPRRMVMGLIYALLGHKELAISELRESVRLDPQNPEPRAALANFYMEQAYEEFDDAVIDKAIAEFKELLRLTPKDVEAHKKLGWLYAAKGLYDIDVFEAREAVKLVNSRINHKDLGDALIMQGEYSQARESFQEALRLEPDNPDIYYSIAILSMMEGNYSEAANSLSTYFEFSGAPSIYPLFMYKTALTLAGKQDDADRIFNANSSRIKPKEWEARLLAIFEGKATEADVLQAARHKGERCEAYYYMGCFQLSRGEREKAVSYFRQARQTAAFGYVEFHQAKARLRELGIGNE